IERLTEQIAKLSINLVEKQPTKSVYYTDNKIVEQEKKKIKEAPTTINLPDMIIETFSILITDISPKIIILPIALTLEIEIDLEIRIITTSTIIIDSEVEANLVIDIDLEIILLIITETTDLEADPLLPILAMSILLTPLMIIPMKNLKLS
ncbi:11729_t:CDS:2, partial [Cetraspora pellucida]